ncbi:hypothetical protein LRO89_02950 [Priestia megaterium]|uniref:hypothetical protein n=1 Tax=Priestia megaterium TaxID=1404 RepID=UPI0039C2E659
MKKLMEQQLIDGNLLIMANPKIQVKKEIEISKALQMLEKEINGNFYIPIYERDGELEYTGSELQLNKIVKQFEKVKKVLFKENNVNKILVGRNVTMRYKYTQGQCGTLLIVPFLLELQAQYTTNLKTLNQLEKELQIWDEITEHVLDFTQQVTGQQLSI